MYTLTDSPARQRDVFALSQDVPEKFLGATVSSSLANANQQRRTIVIDVYLHRSEPGLVRGAGSMIGEGYHRSLFSTLKVPEVEHQPGRPPELVPVGLGQQQTGPTFAMERAKDFLSHGQIQEARQTVCSALPSEATESFSENTRKVIEALSNPKWDFRTIRGLSKATGLSDEKVHRIIEENRHLIRKSRVPDKNGRDLFTLRSRKPKRQEWLAYARVLLTKSLD